MKGPMPVLVLLVGLVLTAFVAAAPEEASPQTLPGDASVLHVLAPPDARVEVEGRPAADTARWTWNGLEPGRLLRANVKAHLADGTQIERRVLYRAGWQIDLSLLPPDAAVASMELRFGTPGNNSSLTPDGRQILYVWGREAVVQDIDTGRCLRRFGRSSGPVAAAAVSPDGRWVVTGGDAQDPTVIFWDAVTGQQGRSLWGHSGAIAAIAFSPDGARVLTGSSDNTAIVWDCSTGQQLQVLRGHRSTVHTAAFSRDGRRAITGSYDNMVLVWDTGSGKLLQTIQGGTGSLRTAAITPDGRQVLTSTWTYYDPELKDSSSELSLWDADTGRVVRKLHEGAGAIASIAPSADGHQVLTSLYHDSALKLPGTVTVWDLASGKPVHEFSSPTMQPYWALWSPDGKQIITSPKEGGILVLDSQTGKELHRVPGQSAGSYYQLAVSSDGSRMASPCSEGLAIWETATGQYVKSVGDESVYHSMPLFTPDGSRILAVVTRRGGDNPTKHLVWIDTDSGKTVRSEEAVEPKQSERALAVSADGRFVLLSDGNRKASLWDAASGRKLRTLDLDAYASSSAALSADGKIAVVGLLQGIKLWNTDSGALLREIKFDDWAEPVALSPDGTRLAAGLGTSGKPAGLIFCNPGTGEILKKIDAAHEDKINQAVFTRDGKYLLTASNDHTAALWDASKGEKLQEFRGHTANVYLAAFLPDERFVLTAGADMTLRYWDVATGAELARMYRSYKGPDWLAVAPNGLFDGTEPFRSQVAFRLGQGPVIEPVPNLIRRFYRPGLMQALLSPHPPQPPAAPKPEPAPLVRIVAPGAEQPFTADQATVVVEVADQGAGVQGPALWQNLNLLATPKEPQAKASPPSSTAASAEKTSRREFKVTLRPGENRFEACAATADGQWPSESVVLVLHYDPPGQEPQQAAVQPASDKPEILLQSGHAGPVTAVAWSRDNKFLLTASEDHSAILWEVATGRQLRRLQGHTGEVKSVAFSADGRLALTGGEDSRAILWDLATGRPKGSFASEYFRVSSVEFSPDGRWVMLAGGNAASLFDATTGRRIRTFRQSGDVRAAIFSPDGQAAPPAAAKTFPASGSPKFLVTAGGEYQKTPQLILWDTATGNKVRSFAGHTEYVKAVAFSADGKLLASADQNRQAIVWDVATGTRLGEFGGKKGDDDPRDIGSLAFSPDGRYLFLGQEGGATAWDIETGSLADSFQSLAGSITALAFSPDARRVLLGAEYRSRGAACVFDTASGQLLQVLRGHTGGILTAAYSPNGKHIATGGDFKDKTVILWDADTGALLHRLTGHTNDVIAMAFTPDGSRLLTACDNKHLIHIWDVATGTKIRTLSGETGGLTTPAWSPDLRYALTPPDSFDDTALIWDVASGSKLRILRGRTETQWAAAFTSDGTRVLTGGGPFQGPAEITVWDASTGQATQKLRVEAESVRQVAVSGDSRQAISLSRDGNAVLWDLASGQPRYTLDSGIESVYVSPDGRLAVTRGGYHNRQTSVWEMESARCRRTFAGEINAVAFSPDSRQLLAGMSGSGLLWDLATGTAVSAFRGLEGETASIALSPDGRQLMTGGGRSAQAAMIWDRQSGQPLKSFRGRVKKVESVGVARAGRILWTAGAQYGQFSEIVFWDPESGQPSRVLPLGNSRLESVRISADGRTLALWDGYTRIAVWRLPAALMIHSLQYEDSYLDWVTMSDDGRRVVAVGHRKDQNNRQIAVWDAETGQQLRAIETGFGEYLHAHISPDGKTILSHPRHVTPCVANLWDADSGRKIRELGTFDNSIQYVAFSPDSRQVFIGHSSQGRLYEIPSGRMIREKAVTSAGFANPVFSPDGRWLATHGGSSDPRIFVWDVQTGEMVRMLRGHQLGIQSLAFLPDNRRLLSGSADGSARVWDTQEGSELVSLISLDDGRDWLTITPEGLFDGSLGGRQAVSWRVPGQEQPVPVDRFFNDFYRAGLLASVVRGEAIEAEVQLGKSLPPRLAILSPASGTVDSSVAHIEVQAVDQGGGISNVSLFQNGARILAAGTTRRDGARLLRTFDVPLIEGRNQIRVTASSQDGSWEADPVELVLLFEKPLAKSRMYVLAIGINQYADAALNLQFAAKDANAVGELFRHRGQKLYEQVIVKTLMDQAATRDAIKQAVKQVAAETRLQDTLVLFLAGHGTMVGQRYYFVPYELRKQADRLEDDLRQQGLPADELSDYLVAAKALKRLLILDTCASGGALAGALRARSGFALREAIERLSRSQGVFTIAASAATEQAQESTALGHGVLTYCLLAGLNAVDSGPLAGKHVQPSSPDQVIDVLEWFTFAAGQVPRLTQKLSGVSQDVQTSTQGASFPVLPLEE